MLNKDNKNSIANNYIVDIIEDKYGYIWVATINGLSRIDVEKDEIKNYYSDRNNGNLSDVFLGLRVWWREITEVGCNFHHTKSRVCTISMIYPC